ncbi:MAG: septum formation protein Maf [Desulfobacter sp.]|nr:MAG: septum formation protein Maf [Desulfobacter sp.]
MEIINTEKIILASGSPRRKELMQTAGLVFDIIPADIDESSIPFNGDPGAYVQNLSARKAEAIAMNHPNAWTVGADTIVVADNTILGKPRDKNDAVAMLTALSGRNHSVFTGFSVIRPAGDISFTQSVETIVTFKPLSREEILWYAGTQEPYDKAGGYGIQGIGSFMVQEIAGSYSNVVGLPVCELIQTLAQLRVIQF